ncbi:MAG: aminotransferase [Alphaproteobacteria bacterium]|nr:aminotransferase [Alphaproteobacteria bacterium]
MKMSRREYLVAAGALPIAAGSLALVRPALAAEAPSLPDKASFVPTDLAYLDSGSQHPMSIGAKAAVDTYLAKRTLDPAAAAYELDEDGLLAKFARMINADVDEVTYIQSTTTGEQMVLRALDIPAGGGHIVTDTLHFFGSLPLYEEMARQGMKVSWLKPVDGRIRIEDMRAAVTRGTRLVALSLVSTINGFEHDLKAVCDIAHASGALVYADIIHAAGAVPVDVKACGVDFAACASYKWLMGDFGLGFLFVRKGVLPRLKRTNYGYYGMSEFKTHIYPLDPPGDAIADYAFRPDATGAFALGTHSHMVIAQLHHSLDYIQQLGVPAIQAHAQTIVERLKRELPRRGYPLMTPAESRAPIVTCMLADARKALAEPMKAAKIRLTLSANRFRLTPSVFNDHDDVDRVLAALPKA